MSSSSPPATPAYQKPTRVRYSILGLLCILAMIAYMDRAMYGSAKNELMASVGQPVENFFVILVAFQLAYALFEIPTGWLGDRYGPRATLIRLVIWWSAFVAFTPAIGLFVPHAVPLFGISLSAAFVVMIAAEFMFGMGEAGAFPNISKAAYNWFPATQRGFAKGAVWMSARFMGGLTPLVWVLLTVYGGLSWRQTLWMFSGIALVWASVYWVWFRNQPSEHWAANEAERELVEGNRGDSYAVGPTPWRKIFASRNLWALCLMYTVTNYNWYFLMYYLPGAMKARFFEATVRDPEMSATAALTGGAPVVADTMAHGDLITPSLLGGGPLLIGMLGCFLGGVLSDRYIRKTGSQKWGRRVYGMLGYALAGVCYAVAAGLAGQKLDGNMFWAFAGALILVGLFNDLIMAPAWATAQDIGRQYAAVVSGTMNMVGNLGAVLGNLITGLILAKFTVNGQVSSQGYVWCFGMYAVVYGLGVASWLLIDASKPVVPDDPTLSSDEPPEDAPVIT